MAISIPNPSKVRIMDIDRIISNGFDFNDLNKLYTAMEHGADFVSTCENIGDNHLKIATEALQIGNLQTARQFFLNASHSFRIGQFSVNTDNADKKRIYKKLIDSYKEAAKLYEPAIERITIPYEDYKMSGYLRLPTNCKGKVPVVISLGGADGWREEHHNYSNFYAERGIGYFIVDGPGQGETRIIDNVYMPIDFEKPIDAVINYLSQDDRIGKLGIVGYSFGGYLAARTAAFSDKVEACCSISGAYDINEGLQAVPQLISVIMASTATDKDESFRLVEKMNLNDMCKNITCPLYLVHGKNDHLFSVKNIKMLYDEASSPNKTLRIWDDGNHCCTNYTAEVTSTVSDWFAGILFK